jgi:hypothetical protein
LSDVYAGTKFVDGVKVKHESKALERMAA